MSDNRPGWFNWLFTDRNTGQIVIAQAPNPSLWIAIGLFVARFVAGLLNASQGLQDGLNLAFTLVILWWASRELFQGVNPWRRILGAAVIVFVLAGRLLG